MYNYFNFFLFTSTREFNVWLQRRGTISQVLQSYEVAASDKKKSLNYFSQLTKQEVKSLLEIYSMDFLVLKYSPDEYFNVVKEDSKSEERPEKMLEKNLNAILDQKNRPLPKIERFSIKNQSQEENIEKFLLKGKARQDVIVWSLNNQIKL